MLMRDPLSLNLAEALVNEVIHREREFLVFLVDHPSSVTPFISGDLVIGLGWTDKGLHWIDWNMKPTGDKVSIEADDSARQWIMESVKRTCAYAAHKYQRLSIAFPQDHIKTQADADKLFRFLGRHHSVHNVRN